MAVMSEISTTAVARRESARHATGQFGEQEHSAPEAVLATVESIEADLARREAEAAERQMFTEVLTSVEDAASMYAARRGQWNDRDDIVGDTILDIIGQQKRGTKHINDAAFKQYSTRAVSSRYVDPNAHHTTLKGRRIFNEKAEQLMQELGRHLTPRERAELADRVRLSFPAGNRPIAGFEQKNVAISLDMTVGEDGGTTLGDLIAAEETGSGYATATSKAAAANDALEEGGSYKAADARKNIWNILADGGPQVAVKTISDDREHRALVEKFGGAAAVARAWQEGETAEDDAVNVALFAPFGNLDERAKDQVTGILLRNTGYADKVWDSAMSAALDVQQLRAIKRRESRKAAKELEAAAA